MGNLTHMSQMPLPDAFPIAPSRMRGALLVGLAVAVGLVSVVVVKGVRSHDAWQAPAPQELAER